MTEFIDISVALRAGLPHWPGSVGYARHEFHTADGVLNSTVILDPHLGTHVDAPRHHLEGGGDVASMDLSTCLGAAFVLDCGDVRVIDAGFLAQRLKGSIPERVLFRTRNGEFYPGDSEFRADFTAVDESGARWLAAAGVRLVGIDYLSIQSYDAGAEVHRLLLQAGVTILECLDLRNAPEGCYELVALPVLIAEAEGAPARALLRPKIHPS